MLALQDVQLALTLEAKAAAQAAINAALKILWSAVNSAAKVPDFLSRTWFLLYGSKIPEYPIGR
jgi:hypothetical protein